MSLDIQVSVCLMNANYCHLQCVIKEVLQRNIYTVIAMQYSLTIVLEPINKWLSNKCNLYT